MRVPLTKAGPGHRGGIYVAVLATALIVTVIGLASLAAWRVQAAAANASVGMIESRLCAEAGIDYAASYLSSNANWRSTLGPGAWWSNVAFGKGSFSVSGVDPLDADLANRPYDPVDITSTGKRGAAVHITSVRLIPQGTPIAALAFAVHTAGQLRVASGLTLTVTGGPASTNTALRNDGTITGSARCQTSTGTGVVSGGTTLLAPAAAMPASGVFAMYQALATPITLSGTTIDKQVLGPGVNTLGGGVNADGVYCITITSDITITRLRLSGTLVINGAGRKVTISGPVLMQPARADYPVLVVKGGVFLAYDSSTSLSESSAAYNFNPSGAPYQGVSDADTADTYPCEIDGLIHSTEASGMGSSGNPTLRGALICEAADATDAFRVTSNATIVYDPALYTSPPMGYTSAITLKISPGSWRQGVLP